jgi:hypothetical protein
VASTCQCLVVVKELVTSAVLLLIIAQVLGLCHALVLGQRITRQLEFHPILFTSLDAVQIFAVD